jgi:hypothetical protein
MLAFWSELDKLHLHLLSLLGTYGTCNKKSLVYFQAAFEFVYIPSCGHSWTSK